MSLAELKEQATGLTLEERMQLASFLAELDEAEEAEFQQAADRRMKAMDSGQKMTAEQLEAEHTRRLRSGQP
jgi:hypothetical protein